MKTKHIAFLTIAFGLLSLILGITQAAAAPAETVPVKQSVFHPTFALLDENGENVLDSGNPISTMETCGACHDTEFIAGHSFHVDAGLENFGAGGERAWDNGAGYFAEWNPITYRYLSPEGDELVDLTTPEWLMTFGLGHVGGGPAVTSRDGSPLVKLSPENGSPENTIMDPETGELDPWDWQTSGVVEMNCFLCHIANPDNDARAAALQNGAFGWANTATLAQTGIVIQQDDALSYNPEAFIGDGTLAPEFVTLQDPTNQNCGTCHGVAHTNPDIPLTADEIDAWRTSTTGQIVSPQRISDSGLNISDKDNLNRSWDIHAERVVECTDCHFSLNNPIYQDTNPEDDLEHLTFDPRRVDIGAYLQRPVHDFARGPNASSDISPDQLGSMRTCESCHDSSVSHEWLPYNEKHMDAMACETCHIPEMYAPAYESVDWTVLLAGADGTNPEPNINYRGIEGTGSENPLITGFEPVLLPRTDVDGNTKLAPFNLVSTWYWVYGEGEETRPVRLVDLEAAYFENGEYAPEIVAAFDVSQNGTLEDFEMLIESDEEEQVVAERLAALGLENPRIVAETEAFPINHGVTNGEWATRDCAECHGEESMVTTPMQLAYSIPAGVMPTFTGASNINVTGEIGESDCGLLKYTPVTAESDLYVIGHDSVGWVDGFGIFSFLAVFFGITVHGGLRYFAARKYENGHETEIKEVYMYTVYERLWHWLQTGAILILLLTGLAIHKPDTFGIFSFRYMVQIHNVLAAVLVINAALSLFYHLVSGEIQQYLPRPRGFFDSAIEQTKFYLQGIFKGDEHPFEKTIDRKLNPLQQMTYFGILNVLLPLQIITGALMWGAQRWPDLAARLGGLPVLGPFHSLVAWMFATFIVAHVYLTTTGPYPMAGIKAMMLGWDEIEIAGSEKQEGKSAEATGD